MFLKQIDLTTALRPSYLPDEVLLFVQDNVGLYEGKNKLPDFQDGQIYLTSHRICFVDKHQPRKNSVGLNLKDVERYEYYVRPYVAGFLKSSPKVTLVPKPAKKGAFQSRAAIDTTVSPASSSARGSPSPNPDGLSRALAAPPPPPQVSAATWVCTICSFPNPVPSNFDPTTANAHTPIPPCLACGIKPSLTHVLKATISTAANRHAAPSPAPLQSTTTPLSRPGGLRTGAEDLGMSTLTVQPQDANATSGLARESTPGSSSQCPRCTFINHPSLLSCEICGAPLASRNTLAPPNQEPSRDSSPAPSFNVSASGTSEAPESIKVSFRNGGEKQFYEKLKGSMTQRKWLLQEAPPVPNKQSSSSTPRGDSPANAQPEPTRVKTAGIAGLEQMGLDRRKNNELTIGNAFEDIDALMASAQEVIALANSFGRQLSGGADNASSEASALFAESASQLGLVTTKDIVGAGSGSGSESLYLSELARNLAEFLTDDARGVLKKAGGIVSLVDLWAMFNRARGGVELVSPHDFEKAARLWEKLKLPVRLRKFKSGVLVVQGSDRTDETTIRSLLDWLGDLHEFPPEKDVSWDWHTFGRGVTAQDAAERFGWSIGVAEEELEMAEERGVICREEGMEGLKFWENFIETEEEREQNKHHRRRRRKEPHTEGERVMAALKDSGLI